MVSSKSELPPSMMMSPGFEVRQEVLDEFVHGLAGLDHEHDAAGLLEQRDHFLDANARR